MRKKKRYGERGHCRRRDLEKEGREKKRSGERRNWRRRDLEKEGRDRRYLEKEGPGEVEIWKRRTARR